MEISSNSDDLKELLFCQILEVLILLAIPWLMDWHKVAVVGCVILTAFLSIGAVIDWLYLSKKIILDESGCTFVCGRKTRTFSWEDIHLQYVENSAFLFGDAEIPGAGIILSSKPISKPEHIGAMTYCRFTHPGKSVFIRFASSQDKLKRTSAKFVFGGFVANKDEIICLLEQVRDDLSFQ